MNNKRILGKVLVTGGLLLMGLSIIIAVKRIIFNNLFSTTYTSNTYSCNGSVTNIFVEDSSGKIIVKSGDVYTPMIIYAENDNVTYEIAEGDLTLSVRRKSSGVNFSFSLNGVEANVIICVPESYDGNIVINGSSGSIEIGNVSLGELVVENSSGSIRLKNVSATETVTLINTSGSISLENVSCKELFTGNSSGSIKYDKVSVDGNVSVSSTSGSFKFSDLKASGDISAACTSGSIKGTIVGKESDFTISTQTTSGSCNLNDTYGGSQYLFLNTTSGSIRINFE